MFGTTAPVTRLGEVNRSSGKLNGKIVVSRAGDRVRLATIEDVTAGIYIQYDDQRKFLVTVDGKEVFKRFLKDGRGDSTRLVKSEWIFSSDGSTWAILAEEDMDTYLVINGEAKNRIPIVAGLVLSRDGKHFAHFAARPETNKKYVVVDGKIHEFQWDVKDAIVFSPDGTRWGVQGRNYVLIEGVPQQQYDMIETHGAAPSLIFSPDGKRYAYVAQRNSRRDAQGREVFDPHMLLVIDGKVEQIWEEIDGGLLWSPDGRSLACLARTEAGKAFVAVVDGKAWPRFDKTKLVGFSPDGKNFAAVARHNEQQFVVLDGKERKAYEEVGVMGTRIGFMQSGKLTYLARQEDNAVAWVEELRNDLPDADPFRLGKNS